MYTKSNFSSVEMFNLKKKNLFFLKNKKNHFYCPTAGSDFKGRRFIYRSITRCAFIICNSRCKCSSRTIKSKQRALIIFTAPLCWAIICPVFWPLMNQRANCFADITTHRPKRCSEISSSLSDLFTGAFCCLPRGPYQKCWMIWP